MNSSLEDILKKHECNNIALEIDLMRHFDVILKEAMDGMVERSNVVDINDSTQSKVLHLMSQ